MRVMKGKVQNGMVRPLEPLELPENSDVVIAFPENSPVTEESGTSSPKPFPVDKWLSLPRLRLGGDAFKDAEKLFDE